MEKSEVAKDARESIQKEIASKDTFTPEEATDLACRYFFYTYESAFHDSDEDKTAGSRFDPSSLEKNRLGPIISDIRQGKFRSLKQELVEEAEKKALMAQAFRGREGPEQFLAALYGVLSPRLLKMAEVIPDEGDPFTPPDPAWTDERFNKDSSGSQTS